MNRDDILRMAREAGLPYAWISETGVLKWSELERFAVLVAAAERENIEKTNACIKALDEELAEAYAEMRKMTEQVESAEPVAWMHTNGVGDTYFRKKPQDKVFNPQPVYLHPKTLTDEDISVLWHQSGEQPFKFARMLLK